MLVVVAAMVRGRGPRPSDGVVARLRIHGGVGDPGALPAVGRLEMHPLVSLPTNDRTSAAT